MQSLRTPQALKAFLASQSGQPGCFADTTFLYALAYDDDRLYPSAIEISEILAEFQIPIYANVISRMEFVDLIFRKQITQGAVEVFKSLQQNLANRDVFNLLKNIRDRDTAHRKAMVSFKVGERQLKDLREKLADSGQAINWKSFCDTYAGAKLFNEWQMMEQELGLNFVELMEGEISPLFAKPLYWGDMVQVMADHGIRGPDAMIVNLFTKSRFPVLITGDADLESCFADNLELGQDRAVLFLN